MCSFLNCLSLTACAFVLDALSGPWPLIGQETVIGASLPRFTITKTTAFALSIVSPATAQPFGSGMLPPTSDGSTAATGQGRLSASAALPGPGGQRQSNPLELHLQHLRQRLSAIRAVAASAASQSVEPLSPSRSSSSSSTTTTGTSRTGETAGSDGTSRRPSAVSARADPLQAAAGDPWATAAGRTGEWVRTPTEAQETMAQAQASETRGLLAAEERQVRLAIAVTLQQLNHQRPDGGRRLPEAEDHYRAVLTSLESLSTATTAAATVASTPSTAPPPSPGAASTTSAQPSPPTGALKTLKRTTPDALGSSHPPPRAAASPSLPVPPGLGSLLVRLGVRSNLAALLLEAERPGEALQELEGALREAEGNDHVSAADPGLLCGLRFNRAKALAAFGRTAEADAVYAAAAIGAVGLAPGCFTKSCAAMTFLPDDLLALARSAVQLAEDTGLRRLLLATGAAAAPSAVGVPGGTDPPLDRSPLPVEPHQNSSPTPTPTPISSSSPSGLPNLHPGLYSSAPGAGPMSGSFGGGGPPGAVPAAPSAPMAPEGGGTTLGVRGGSTWLAGMAPSELGWLYFALAKALDQRAEGAAGGVGGCGDGGGGGEAVQDAWDILVKANDLLSSEQTYDPATDWQQLRIVTSVFTAPLLGAVAAAGGGYSDPTPVFVVGLPRSGSTLVEAMLSSYPGVWGAGEDTALAPLTTEINYFLSTQGLNDVSKLEYFGRRYVGEMAQRYLAAGGDPQRPPRRIVDKMLRNLWLLGHIQLLLPRACLVHVVRHPLDAALSCYSLPFGYSGMPWSWRLEHIAEQVRMTAALAAHWRRHLPPGRLLTLHYEEVVAAPEASARRLLAHCGVGPWDPRVLDFHTANLTIATASAAQVRQPLHDRSVGRWRKYERQLAPLLELLKPEVAAYEAELEEALRAARRATYKLRHLRETQQQATAAEAGPGTDAGHVEGVGGAVRRATEGKGGGVEYESGRPAAEAFFPREAGTGSGELGGGGDEPYWGRERRGRGSDGAGGRWVDDRRETSYSDEL